MGFSFLFSLRFRLILLVAVAVVPAFALILYGGFEERRDDRAAARDDALGLTQLLASQHGQLIEGARARLVTLAALISQADPSDIDPSACGTAFAAMLEQDPRYTNLGVADANGDVFCSALPQTEPADASEGTWFMRAVESRDFAIGDYQIGTIAGKAAVNFGYPVIDDQGAVGVVIFSALDLSWLNALLAEAELPEQSSVSIVDRNGIVLARYPDPERWVGQEQPEAAQALGDTVVDVRGIDGVERLYASAPLGSADDPGAYMRVGISTAAAFADANETLVRNLALLAVVAALALAAAWFAGDWFVLRGVRSLMRATDRVGLGDLSARAQIAERSELGQLANSFNSMADAIQQRDQLQRRTEQQLAERADDLVRSNAELEQFAYVASHDLQEPLRMVGNYTQLLARRYEGKLDADADEFIGYAVDGASRMQTLINDLLAFSRVGTRGKELSPTNAEEVLQRTVRTLSPAMEEAEAVVTHDPLPAVMADEGQLGQVFQNLIGNAIKFRGKEPPRVHVSAAQKDGRWLFSVRDNGIGIEEEFHDRIFVLFQRLHGREKYQGTGIGLAVCKKIVERHGGRLWLESTPGSGAVFYFTLTPAVVEAAA